MTTDSTPTSQITFDITGVDDPELLAIKVIMDILDDLPEIEPYVGARGRVIEYISRRYRGC